ncbi:23S rRNA (pseudouridine(1915)-N(3))-methyltransferase RlmH [Silvanigrella aquatica]|uniref:Ribosomal RNA large subunit methyltransferase H n=1 Tax=Silvanigrella aquatica TaxID=1915309 RepID=A0A1L4CXX0_9BACT|nr:23S rRNA (pseudouridine(1915)-N(3))-methyltransferase RlmH [Silvanigrella aquatica]APJ02784.1 hypothetical protein AXG55_02130 [Silvanigrella aquatica]
MRYVVLTPWKIPQQSLLFDYVQEFLDRISKYTPTTHIYPSSSLAQEDLAAFYTKEFKKLSVENPLCIAFDENGAAQNSFEFAKRLDQFEQKGEKMVIFCLGGAYGLPREIKALGRIHLISLSKMTFPHELALGILLEQIYRARCILSNHPYHHGDISALAQTFSKEIRQK